MGINLKNKSKEELNISNIVWAYLLNLGEQYNWKPVGTIKPRNYGFLKKWNGVYDSSDGQRIMKEDAKSLSKSLRDAIVDDKFEINSSTLIENLQNAIEESLGKKLEYKILENMNIEFIEEVLKFLDTGEIEIN